MTEKTEEMIERERQAVASMASAKANMTKVLDRVDTLEKALRSAQSSISELKTTLQMAHMRTQSAAILANAKTLPTTQLQRL